MIRTSKKGKTGEMIVPIGGPFWCVPTLAVCRSRRQHESAAKAVPPKGFRRLSATAASPPCSRGAAAGQRVAAGYLGLTNAEIFHI